MEKKEMTGFQGIFFDEINKKKLIDLQERKLKYVVKDMHITFKFGKTEKYPEEVTVYTIGNVSKELCGGPHVQHTGELGHFKIVKEEACSSGVRRIKAILE